MATEKIINTRIQLKYDSYANWTTNNPTLKSGEVAIAYLATSQTETTPNNNTHPVMFKVGPGAFNSLPWSSALAADVHAWAKKSETEFTTWVKTLIVPGDIDAYTKGEVNKLIADLDVADAAVAGKYVSAVSETDGKISVTRADLPTYTLVEGTANGTVKFNDTDVAVHGLQDAAYATVASLNATAKGYADAVEQKLPTSANYGVLTVDEGDDTITIGGTAQNPTIKVTPNTFDAAGAAAGVQENLTNYENAHASDYTNAKIDELIQGAKDYADTNDTNTAHTHVNGKGIKVDAAGGISGEVKADLNVAFELVDKTIKLYDKDDASKTAIATLDASEFIADGMLASVTADQENNKLVFEWNTDAGVTKTEIALSSIADIYTGKTGDEVNVNVSNTNEISASLNANVTTKIGHGETAYGWGDHASAGYAANADLTKVINGTTAVAKATDADKLGGQAPSYYATAASVTDITKDNGIIDNKIVAYNTSKNFGDIITHNASEFALADIDTGVHSVALASGTNNGTLKLTVDGATTDNIAVQGLKSAAYTESTAYATSAQGALADTAVQGVTNMAGNGLVMSKSADNKVSVDWDPNVVFVFNCGSSSVLVD